MTGEQRREHLQQPLAAILQPAAIAVSLREFQLKSEPPVAPERTTSKIMSFSTA